MAEIRIKNFRRITVIGASIDAVKRKDFSKEFVDKGYDYARNIAPQSSGALKQAIQKVYSPAEKSGRIRVVQPRGSTRPYHMWMHGIKAPAGSSGKGYDLRFGWNVKYRQADGSIGTKRAKIMSGIPDFMFKTREYLQNQTKASTEKQVKQLFK